MTAPFCVFASLSNKRKCLLLHDQRTYSCSARKRGLLLIKAICLISHRARTDCSTSHQVRITSRNFETSFCNFVQPVYQHGTCFGNCVPICYQSPAHASTCLSCMLIQGLLRRTKKFKHLFRPALQTSRNSWPPASLIQIRFVIQVG